MKQKNGSPFILTLKVTAMLSCWWIWWKSPDSRRTNLVQWE